MVTIGGILLTPRFIKI